MGLERRKFIQLSIGAAALPAVAVVPRFVSGISLLVTAGACRAAVPTGRVPIGMGPEGRPDPSAVAAPALDS